MGFREALVVGGLVGTLGLWAVLELYWAPWAVRLKNPIRVFRRE
jgi:hypothetical protein